jgi:hypothetical protein
MKERGEFTERECREFTEQERRGEFTDEVLDDFVRRTTPEERTFLQDCAYHTACSGEDPNPNRLEVLALHAQRRDRLVLEGMLLGVPDAGEQP